MTLDGLQSALQRIQEIRSRFEPTAAMPDGADFGAVLDQAGEAVEAMNGGIASNSAMAGTAPLVPENLESLIQNQAGSQGLDPDLLKAVIRTESNFNARAVSGAGAQGLMQLMPGTARGLGVTDSFNPLQNIAGGAKYLKTLLNKYDQSLPKALAAYNAGPGAVDRHNGIPPYAETRNYVKKVMASYQAYQAKGAQQGQIVHQRQDIYQAQDLHQGQSVRQDMHQAQNIRQVAQRINPMKPGGLE